MPAQQTVFYTSFDADSDYKVKAITLPNQEQRVIAYPVDACGCALPFSILTSPATGSYTTSQSIALNAVVDLSGYTFHRLDYCARKRNADGTLTDILLATVGSPGDPASYAATGALGVLTVGAREIVAVLYYHEVGAAFTGDFIVSAGLPVTITEGLAAPSLTGLQANPTTVDTDGTITLTATNNGGTVASVSVADPDGPITVDSWSETSGTLTVQVSGFNTAFGQGSLSLTATNATNSDTAAVQVTVNAPVPDPFRYYGTDAQDLIALIGTDAAAAATAVLAMSSRRDANALGSESLTFASGEYGYWVVEDGLAQPSGFTIDGGLPGSLASATLSITNADGTTIYRLYRTAQFGAGTRTLAAV